AAIAIALGAIGGALQGTNRNDALDIILKQVDQDIDEQKENIGGKREQAQLELGVYDRMRAKFDDDTQASAAAKMALIDQTRARIESLAAQSESELVKQNAAATVGQLNEEYAKTRMLFDQRAEQLAAKRATTLETYVPGVGTAYDKKAANDARKIKAAYDDSIQKFNDLIALRKKKGFELLDRPTVRRAKALSSDLKISLKNMAGLGQISAKDAELMSDQIPDDPTGLGFNLSTLEQAKRNVITRADTSLRTLIYDYQGLPEENPLVEPIEE
ncbi:hypothetical protein L0337_05710, partial [candidate division KSB1 bacterium]|nr:hypothetical protein [candidate division KSB1 bacterium]